MPAREIFREPFRGNRARLFRCTDTALLRAPALPRNRFDTTRTEFPENAPGESAELVRLLHRLGADQELRDAVALASPSLDRLLTEVGEGRPVEPKRLCKALLALSRYLLRATSRPTPFGLFSGVAAVRIADRPTTGPGSGSGSGSRAASEAGAAPGSRTDSEVRARLGGAHRVAVRPDMGWLTAVLAELELRPDTLTELRITANDLAFVRGTRLVLPYVPERHGTAQQAGGTLVEVSVRCTPAVRAVLELTERPVRYAELAQRLGERFPGVPAQRAADLLRQLVEREFLLTDLRPPATATDPLAHVLERLPAGPARSELTALRRELERSGTATDRSAALARMRRLHDADRPHHADRPHDAGRLLQLDLALDAEVTLPAAVAAEAERAAEVLWRTSRARDVPHLAQYHRDFVELYGTDRLVPLTELLDPDRGLGAPAGYLLPPSERERPAPAGPSPQDAVRIELAQAALLDGHPEVVLDEALIARLTPDSTLAPPRSLDLYARVLAGSTEELAAGRFRLWLSPESAADHAGATVGRFSHLLPEAAERIAAAGREAEGRGADTAQLVLRAAHSRSANLDRVRRLHDRRITVGAFTDRTDPGTVPLADLAVGADLDALHLTRLSTGRRIVPLAWNMLNPQAQAGNTGRLLRELRLSGVRPGFTWDWGPMEQAPYTPRVRYGRTVLAPARWRPTAPFFTDAALTPEQWRRDLDGWRERWAVPDRVLLCVADRALELDLTAGLHVRLLRQDLARHPDAVLREAPTGAEAYGWLTGPQGAHTAEVVFPLLADLPADRTPTAPPAPEPAPRLQPPGGAWLYAKLYTSSRRQNEILVHRLPQLLAQLPAAVDHWHFVRYRDPQPHLRLRFHGEPTALNGELLPTLHDWSADLHRAGLAGRLVLDSYEPEWERYGGRAATSAAEQAFHADSTAVLAQLTALESGLLTLEPALLGALNLIDLLRQLHGEDHFADRLLTTYPRAAAPRGARTAAIRLTDPAALRATPGGPELLTAWQHRAETLRRHAPTLAPAAPSLIHMHHNRLLGIDPTTESRAHAIARATTEALHHRP
ncbi:lantibiotic dehydratase [Kitasatospora sp. NPDC089797]|uniref:lantibiotic dehydratase n=1 Tax=Kitasatospora sp. NPDC089797 TaxID=3155298 RepID=UPI00342B4EBF